MAHNVPWTKPYPGISKLPSDEIKRITVEMPMADAHVILALTMSPFLLPTLCQYAIKLTAAEIRKHKLVYPDDSRAFLNYICQRTFSSFAKDTGAHAIAGTVEGEGDGTASPVTESTGAGKEITRGSGDKEGKGVGKKKR